MANQGVFLEIDGETASVKSARETNCEGPNHVVTEESSARDRLGQ